MLRIFLYTQKLIKSKYFVKPIGGEAFLFTLFFLTFSLGWGKDLLLSSGRLQPYALETEAPSNLALRIEASDRIEDAPELPLLRTLSTAEYYFSFSIGGNATPTSGLAAPSCLASRNVLKDKWVKFLAPDSVSQLTIATQFQNNLSYPTPILAFYQKSSSGQWQEIGCKLVGDNQYQSYILRNFTPGDTLWLRLAEANNLEVELNLMLSWTRAYSIEGAYTFRVDKKGRLAPLHNNNLTAQSRICLSSVTSFYNSKGTSNCQNIPTNCGWNVTYHQSPCTSGLSTGYGSYIGSLENPVFFYFVVTPSTPQPPSVTINVSNCTLPPGALAGLQAGIWSAAEANVADPNQRGGCKSTFHGAGMGQGSVTITASQNLTNGTLPPGEYILMIDGINQSMCDFTFSGPVVPDPTPVVPNGILSGNSYQLVCGLPLSLDVNDLPSGAPFPNFQVQWQGPNGFTSNQKNPTVTPAVAGTYTVTITGSGNCPITVTKTLNVTLSDLLAPSVSSNAPICEGATLQLTANTNAAQTPLPGPPVTYSWSGPNGFSSAQQNPSIPNMGAAQVGTYTVTITRPGCNSISSTTSVNIVPLPGAPTVANVVRCGPGNVVITAVMNTPAGNLIRVYDQPAGGTLITTAGIPFQATIPNLSATTTVYVEPVTNPGNCSGSRTSVIAEVVNLPSRPSSDNVVRCGPGQVTFTASMGAIPGNNYFLYTLAVGGTPIATAALPSNTLSASPTATTTYYIGAAIDKPAGITPAIQCFSSTRDTVIATINPVPGIPTAPPVGKCGGGVVTFTVNPGNPAGDLIELLDGTTLISTDNTPPYQVFSSPITTTTNFCLRAINTTTSCTSACGQATAVYDSLPSPPAGAAAPRCSTGQVVITATMPGPIMGQVVRLYEQQVGGAPIGNQGGPSPYLFTLPSVSVNSTYYLEVFRPNTQCVSSRTPVTITIHPNPEPPISSDIALCEGGVATFTAFMGTPPGSLALLYATSSGGTPISTSTSPYFLTSSFVSTTTDFYFEAVNTTTGCTSSTRSIYKVIVNKNPVAPTALPVARCGPGAVTITANLGIAPGLPSGNVIRLYTQPIPPLPPSSSIASDDSPPYNLITPNFNQDTTVWIDAFDQATNCFSARVPVTVTIEPLPGAPSAPPLARCGPGPITFTAQMGNPAANEIRIYENATGGFPLSASSGPIYQLALPTIGATTTYYLASRFTASGCETRTPLTVTINPQPVAPSASGVSVCSCENTPPINITFPSAPVGDLVRVYSTPSGGVPLQTLLSAPYEYSQQQVCATTTLYLESEITQTGCISPSRSALTITALTRPSEPIAQNQSRCGTGSVIFPVSMGAIAGTSVRLYDSPSSASPISVDNLPPYALETNVITQTGTVSASATYYVEAVLDGSGCASATRKAVIATVHPVPGPPFAPKITKCGAGGPATFSAIMGVPPGTELRLFTTTSPIANPIATDNTPPYLLTFNLVATSTYYLENFDANTGCGSSRVPVEAQVGVVPGPPLVFNVSRCGGGPITLSVAMGNPASSFLQLFDSPTGGNLLGTTTSSNLSFYLPSVQSSTTLYVQAARLNSGDTCFSPRVPVTIEILEMPSPPLVENVSRCGGGALTFTASMGDIQGNEIRMYTSPAAQTPINSDNVPPYLLTTPPVATGSITYLFSAVNTTNGCESARVGASASVFETPSIPTVAPQTRCGSGTVTFTATMGAIPGNIIQMYTQLMGGEPVATALNSPYQITSSILTTNIIYYFEAATVSNCRSSRVPATVTIYPIPEPPIVPSVGICEKQLAIFTALGVDAGMQVNLYSVAGAANEIAFSLGPVYTLPIPEDSTKIAKTTTFYVNVENTTTSCKSQTVPAVLVVNAIPNMPPSVIAQRCGPGSVVFTLQMGALPGTEIRLYNQPIGGTPIATDGLSPFLLESEPISANTTYYATSFNAATGCESDRRPIEALIKGPKPGAPSAPSKTICGGGEVVINAQMGTPTGTIIRLWDSPIPGAGTVIDSTSQLNFPLKTPELNSTAVFYLESVDQTTGCVSDRVPVQIIVAPIPGAPDAISLSRCGEGSLIFTFQMGQPAGTEIRLYTALNSGSTAFRNAPYLFITPPLNASTSYYISSANPITGCESAKTMITATINPIPGKAITADVARCGPGSVNITSQMTAPEGDIMRLYSAPVGGNPIYTASAPFNFTTPLIPTTITYYIESAFQFTGCVADRVPVVITINPIPGTPKTRNISVCRGNLAVFSVTPGNPAGDVMRLYSFFAGGEPISVDPSQPYQLSTPAGITSTFYVENLNSTTQCASDRQPVIVFVNDVPGEPYVQSLSRCAPGSLTFTAIMNTPSGNEIRMYDAPIFGTLLQRNTSSPFTFNTGQLAETQTFYFESINTVTGCASPRSMAVAQIFPLPPMPIAQPVARCGPGVITFSPTVGAPLIESEIRLFDFDNNLLAVTSEFPYTLQIANLNASTRFIIQTHNITTGCNSHTSFVNATIHPIPGAPQAAEVKRCGAGSVSISILMGEPAGSVINLYADPFQQVPLARDFTPPYLISGINVSATRNFYIESVNELTGCKSNKSEAKVQVFPIPAPPSVLDITRCGGGQVTFSFSMNEPAGTEVRLYEANIGGNFVGKDSDLPYEIATPVVQNTTTFFVSSYNQNTACESQRLPVVAFIAPKPGAPYATNIKQCADLPLFLNAMMGEPQGDMIRLYSNVGANLPLAVRAEAPYRFQINQTETIVTYFLESFNSSDGCKSDWTSIEVELLQAPSLPQVNDVIRCGPGTATITVAMGARPGDEIRIYDSPAAGQLIAVDNAPPYELVTPFLPNTVTYYVESYSKLTSCKSPRAPVVVNIIPAPLPPIISGASPTCTGQWLNLTASAAPGVTFLWEGPNGFSATGSTMAKFLRDTEEGGVYKVSVIANGCTSRSATTFVEARPTPDKPLGVYYNQLQQTRPLCEGDELNLGVLNFNQYLPNTTFEWIGPNGYVASPHPFPAIPSVATIQEGPYYVRAIYNGCSSALSDPVEVRIFKRPEAPVATSNNVVCEGGLIRLFATEVPNISQYLWIGPNGFSATQRNLTLPATLPNAGIYTVQVVNEHGCTSQKSTASVTVQRRLPSPSLAYNGPLCIGQTLRLTITSPLQGVSYRIVGPANFSAEGAAAEFQIPNMTPDKAGVYQVTAIQGVCTSQTSSLNVIVRRQPEAPTLNSNGPKCEGEILRLTAIAANEAAVFWQGPNNFSAEGQTALRSGVTFQDAGTYSAIAIIQGCTSNVATLPVVIAPMPGIPQASNDGPVCVGRQLTLMAEGVPEARLFWQGPDGWFAEGATVVRLATSTAASGHYTVNAIIGQCTTRAQTPALVIPTPALPQIVSDSPKCPGEIVNLIAQGEPGSVYHWFGPANFSATGARVQRQLNFSTEAGVYSVIAELNGCSSQIASVGVSLLPLPQQPEVFNNTPQCEGESLFLTATSFGAEQYYWRGPLGFTALETSGKIQFPQAKIEQAGVFSVAAIAGGCTSLTATTILQIYPFPAPPQVRANTARCLGNQLFLTAETAVPAAYLWTGPAGFLATGSVVSRTLTSSLESGIYQVRAVIGSCTSEAASIVIRTQPPLPTPIIQTNDPQCVQGFLTLTALGVENAQYFWEGPNAFSATGQTVSRVAHSIFDAGVYTVTAVANGCSSSATANVIIYDPNALVTVSSNSPLCVGGTLQLNATSISNASYIWRGPGGYHRIQRNPIRPNLKLEDAGTYYLTVVIGACSSRAIPLEVNIFNYPPTPVAGYSGPLCEGQTLSLTAAPIPGARYHWTGPNHFTSSLQNPRIPAATTLEAGTYKVSAFFEGCTSSSSMLAVEIFPTPSKPVVESPGLVCSGQNIRLAAQSTPGAVYHWSGPNNFYTSSQNPLLQNVSSLQDGIYQVIAVIRSCTSEPAQLSIRVLPTPPQPVITSNAPLCAGQTLHLAASFLAGVEYYWRGPGNLNQSGASVAIPNVTTNHAGPYTVVAERQGCVSTAASVWVEVEPAPQLAPISANAPLCEGQTLQLWASRIEGASYSWSGPAGFTSSASQPLLPAVSTANSGLYSLSVALGNCTSQTLVKDIRITPKPQKPDVEPYKTACVGQNIQLIAQGSPLNSYFWQGPDFYESSLQAPVIVAEEKRAGEYSVVAIQEGCTSDVAKQTIAIVNPFASLAIHNNPVLCEGSTATLSATFLEGFEYQWSGPSNFSAIGPSVSIENVTLLQAGTYSLAVYNAACTSALYTTLIRVAENPRNFTVGNNGPLCEGQNLSLSAPVLPSASYLWKAPDGWRSEAPNAIRQSVLPASGGSYSLEVITAACTARYETPVIIRSRPNAPNIVSNSPVCETQALTLSTLYAPGAVYLWSGPANWLSNEQNPAIPNISIAQAGEYRLYYVVEGCTSLPALAEVMVYPAPNIPILTSNSPVCEGKLLQVTVSTLPGLQYAWQGPAGFSSTESSFSRLASLAHTGTYILKVQDERCSVEKKLDITVNPTPKALEAGNNGPLCAGQTLNLTATTILSARYFWSGPGGYSSTLQNPVINPASVNHSGPYSVTAIWGACSSDVVSTNVTINPSPAGAQATANTPLCEGQTLQLTATFLPGATYLWRGPQGFLSTERNPQILEITTVRAGVYSLQIRLGACPSALLQVPVSVLPAPTNLNISASTPVCAGGEIVLTATSIPNARYFWTGPASFASTVQNPRVLNAGTANSGIYSLLAVVGNCTSSLRQAEVKVTPVPRPFFASVNSPLCSGNTASFTATTFIGASYQWVGPNNYSSNTQNPSIVNVALDQSGVYTVVATVEGCTVQANARLEVRSTPEVQTLTASSPVCENRALALSALANMSGATYFWSGPGGFTSTSSNPTRLGVTFADSGAYSVAAIVNGCTSAIKTLEVAVRPTPPLPSIATNAPVCWNQTLWLYAEPVAGASYLWGGPNQFSSTLLNPSVARANKLNSGLYSLATVVNGCTSDVATRLIAIHHPELELLTTSQRICQGDTARINLIMQGTGPWNVTMRENGQRVNLAIPTSIYTLTSNPLSSTTYQFEEVIDANGCRVPLNGAESAVRVDELPTAALGNVTQPCYGARASVPITVRGITGNWTLTLLEDGAARVISGVGEGIVNYLTQPLYGATSISLVTIANTEAPRACNNNLAGSAARINVATFPPSVARWEKDTIWACPGQEIYLPLSLSGSAPFTIRYQNKFGTYTKVWDTQGGNQSLINDWSYTTSGDDEIRILEITDGNGCVMQTNSLKLVIRQKRAPILAFGADSIRVCWGQPAILPLWVSALGQTRIAYAVNGIRQETTWVANSNERQALQWQVEARAKGNYRLLEIIDQTGCQGAVTNPQLTLEVDSLPNVLPLPSNNSPLCGAQPLHLSAKPIAGATSYLWKGPNGFTSTELNPSLAYPYAGGEYSLVAINGACTSQEGTTVVTISEQISLNAWGDEKVCLGQSINLFATPIPGAQYFWQGPAMLNSVNNRDWLAGTPSVAGVYSVYAIIGGCTSNVATHRVEVYAPPKANWLSQDVNLCDTGQPQNITLNIELSGEPPLSLTYLKNGAPYTLHNLTPGVLSIPASVEANTLFQLQEVRSGGVCGEGRASGSLSVRLAPKPTPFIQTVRPNSCAGASFLINATGGEPPYAFSIPALGLQQTTGRFEGILPGSYTVGVADRNGCAGFTILTVDSLPAPQNVTIQTGANGHLVSWLAVPGAAFYEVAYRFKGELEWSTLTAPQNFTTIPVTQPGRIIEFRALAVCASGQRSKPTSIFEIPSPAVCRAPLAVSVRNLALNSVEMEWEQAPAVCYIIAYGLVSEPEENWTEQIIPFPSNTLAINNLIPGQAYGAKVRSNCSVCSIRNGNRSEFTPKLNFSTPPAKEANSIAGDANFTIYPNPASAGVYITNSLTDTEKVGLTILDINGRVLLNESPLTEDSYISLEAFENGVYIFEIKYNNAVEYIKVVKR